MPTVRSAPSRPEATEYAPFYAGYVANVPEDDVLAALRSGGRELESLLAPVAESRAGHRYAPDKWSVREMIGHLIDAERVFSYRALRLARGDRTPLPAFDENEFVRAAGSDARTLTDLAEELALVRESSLRLFASMPAEAWTRRGVVNGNETSVRALAYIIAGHGRHHVRILRERYGL
jgi:hypothetical protein